MNSTFEELRALFGENPKSCELYKIACKAAGMCNGTYQEKRLVENHASLIVKLLQNGEKDRAFRNIATMATFIDTCN